MASTFQPTTAPDAVRGLPQVFDPTAAEGVEAVGLILHRGAAPHREQRFDDLPLGGFLPAALIVHGVEDLVHHARDLALRNHEVAAAERPAPVRSVRAKHAENALGQRAIGPHAIHGDD